MNSHCKWHLWKWRGRAASSLPLCWSVSPNNPSNNGDGVLSSWTTWWWWIIFPQWSRASAWIILVVMFLWIWRLSKKENRKWREAEWQKLTWSPFLDQVFVPENQPCNGISYEQKWHVSLRSTHNLMRCRMLSGQKRSTGHPGRVSLGQWEIGNPSPICTALITSFEIWFPFWDFLFDLSLEKAVPQCPNSLGVLGQVSSSFFEHHVWGWMCH